MSNKATTARGPVFNESWILDNVTSLVYDVYGTQDVYVVPEGDKIHKGKKCNTLIDVIVALNKGNTMNMIYDNTIDLPYTLSINSTSLIHVIVEGESISVEVTISTLGKYVSIEHSSDLKLFFVFSKENLCY